MQSLMQTATSQLMQTNPSQALLTPDLNRYLANLGEDCKFKGFRLRDAFSRYDTIGVGKVSFYEFRNTLEKINPNIPQDAIYKMSRPFITTDERVNYDRFAREVDRLLRSRLNFHLLLDQIIERFEAGETNLFDLFRQGDKNGNGTLSRKEFEDILNNFGIYTSEGELDDAIAFLDLNGDRNLDYNELRIVFNQYCRDKGKNFEELQRSNLHLEDPQQYWAKDIMATIHRYIQKQSLNLEGFLMNMGMEQDGYMSRFDFETAIATACPGLDTKREERLCNEFEDRKMGKISIEKFKRMYEKVNQISGTPSFQNNRQSFGGGVDPTEKTAEEALQKVINAINVSGQNVSSFFEKFSGYNKFLRNIKDDNFLAAAKSLNLFLTSSELRAISFQLDKRGEGVYDLSKVFAMRPTQTDAMTYQPTERVTAKQSIDPRQLQQLLDRIAEFLYKEHIDLYPFFKKLDFRNDGYVTVDEFKTALAEARLALDPHEFEMIKQTYCNVRGEFEYRKFLEIVQSGANVKKEVENQSKQRLLRDFYGKIRENFTTLEDFFNKYDTNRDRTIDKAEFIRIIHDFDQRVQHVEAVELFNHLDPSTTGRLHLYTLNQAFRPYMEADVKDTITTIVNGLSRKQINYYNLMSTYPTSGPFIKRLDFQEALESLGIRNQITKKSVDFLISFLGLKPNNQQEIDFEEFGTSLVGLTKQLQLFQEYELQKVFDKTAIAVGRPTSEIQRFVDKLSPNNKRDLAIAFCTLELKDPRFLQLEEFERLLLKIDPQISYRYVEDLFRELDKSNSRYVPVSEFFQVFGLGDPGTDRQPVDKFQSQLSKNPLEMFRENLSTQIKKDMYNSFKNLLRKDPWQLDFQDFSAVVRKADRYITDDELRVFFNLIDVKRQAKITDQQFLDAFGLGDVARMMQDTQYQTQPSYQQTRTKNALEEFVERLTLQNRKDMLEAFRASGKAEEFIDYDTFKRAIQRVDPYIHDSEARKIWTVIDFDYNNKVSAAEVYRCLKLDRSDVQVANIEIVRKTAYAAEFLKDLTRAVMRSRRPFKEEFPSYDGKMPVSKFKLRLSELDVKPSSVLNQLIADLSDDRDFNSVNLFYLEQCYEHYKTVVTQQESLTPQISALDLIRDKMKFGAFDFTIFEKYDRNYRGTISEYDFQDVLQGILRLNLTSAQIVSLEKEICDITGAVSLNKLREALGFGSIGGGQVNPQATRELGTGQSADALVRKIKDLARFQGFSMARLFSAFDADKSEYLEFIELVRIISYLDPTIPKTEIVELFKRFDRNKDGRISLREFLAEFPEERAVSPDEAQNNLSNLKKKLQISDTQEMARMFSLIDTSNTRAVTLDQFAAFVMMVEPGFNRDQIIAMFQLIDADQNGRLTYNEFKRHFDPNNISNLKYDDSHQTAIQRAQWAGPLLEEIDYLLKINNVGFRDFFASQNKLFKVQLLKQKLLSLDLDFTQVVFNKLLDTFGAADNADYIDLHSFQIAFEFYNKEKKQDIQLFKTKHLEKLKDDIKLCLSARYTNFDTIFGKYEQLSVDQLDNLLRTQLGLSCPTNLKILGEHIFSTNKTGSQSYLPVRDLRQFIGYDGNNATIASNKLSYTNMSLGRVDQIPTIQADLVNHQDKWAVSLLNQLKVQAESAKIEVEKLFEPFHINKTDKLDFTEFSYALKKIKNDLARDDLIRLFKIFDREGRDEVSKFNVIYCLSRVPGHRIVKYLESHWDIFAEISRLMAAGGTNAFKVFKPENNIVSAANFQLGLTSLGFDVERYRRDLNHIKDALLEGRKDGLNYQFLELCLDTYRQNAAYVQKKLLNPHELENVQKVLKAVHNFMTEDNISFDELFSSKDKQNSGTISREDLQHALVKQLRVDETPALQLMMDYVSNEYGRVPLRELREHFGFSDKGPSNRTTFGGMQGQGNMMTLQEFVNTIRTRFNGNTEAVVKFYDKNDSKSISKKEFVDTTISLLGISDLVCASLFRELDKQDSGVIPTWQLKDLLDAPGAQNTGFLLQLAQFVNTNEKEILKSLRGVDENGWKKLHNNQIKMAFSVCGFSMTNEQVQAVIQATQVPKDMNQLVNYEELVERIKRLQTEAHQKGGASVDDVLRKIKSVVIAKGIDLVQALKKWDRRGDGFVPITSIIDELSKFDIYISRDDRDAVFALLPQIDSHVNHVEFAKLVINGRGALYSENEMRAQFSWATPLLRMIQQKLAERSTNIPRFFNTTNEFYPIIDFRTGLQKLGIDYGSQEMRTLIDQLTNPSQPLNLSLFMLSYLLDNLNHLFGAPQKQTGSTQQFTPEEEKLITTMAKNISNFMKEDNLTFKGLFGKYDPRNQGFIYTEDLKRVLYDDLQIDETDKTNKFVVLMSDERKCVDLFSLETRLTGGVPIARTTSQYTSQLPQTFSPEKMAMPDQSYPVSGSPTYYGTDYRNKEGQITTTKFPESRSNQVVPLLTGTMSNTKPMEKLPLEPLDDTPQGLVNQIKQVFRNRRYTMEQKYNFFDEYGTGHIPMDIFVEKLSLLGVRSLTDRSKAEGLFFYLDANQSKAISKQEFYIIFEDGPDYPQRKDIVLGNEIEREIYRLFKEIDANNDETIGREELARCLSVVGGDVSDDELDRIFAQLDANRDGKVSFEEFKYIMEQKLKKDLLQMEQLLSDLRYEFKKADINNDRQLAPNELNQVLINLGIDLKREELQALVKEIDVNKNGKIDIDEFIDFMSNSDEHDFADPLANTAVLNIKKYKKLSPFDLYNCFKLMPQNFMLSFTRELNRIRENLPSSTIKPQLDAGGIFFTDLFPKPPNQGILAQTKLPADKKPINSYLRPSVTDYGCEIKFVMATGIPIPSEQIDRRGQLIAREVRAVLFDFNTSKFVGNVVTVAADWKPEYEDRWYFNLNKIDGESRLYFRISDFDERAQTNLAIVFEFVVFYKVNDTQLIEMSSGWTKIEVTTLRTAGSHVLSLSGGSPKKMLNINDTDVRTKREGWRFIVKKITKKIISKLSIEVTPHEKLPLDVKNQLSLMPKSILMNKNSLNLLRYAREHLGKLFNETNNTSAVLQNVHAKTFRNAMDCPDVWNKFYLFWNLNIQPRLIKATNPDNGVEYLIKCLDHLYLLFSSVDFMFTPSDPTQRTYQDYSLHDKRAKLLNNCFEKILQSLSITTTAKKIVGIERGFEAAQTYKPFNILELIDEDEDSYLMEQLQKIKML